MEQAEKKGYKPRKAEERQKARHPKNTMMLTESKAIMRRYSMARRT